MMNIFRTPLVILLLLDIPLLLVALGLTSWLISIYSTAIKQIVAFQDEPPTTYSQYGYTSTSYPPLSIYSVDYSSFSYTVISHVYTTETSLYTGTLTDISGKAYDTFTDTYTETRASLEFITNTKRSAAPSPSPTDVFSATLKDISLPMTATPTAATTAPSAKAPSPTAMPKLRIQQSNKLTRRDHSFDEEIQFFRKYLGLSCVMLIAIIVRLFLNVVTIVVLSKHKRNQAALHSTTTLFIAVDVAATFIFLIFSLSLIIYLRIVAGPPFGTDVVFYFFWMFIVATGIVEVVLALIFLKQVAAMDDEDDNGGSGQKHGEVISGKALLPSLQKQHATTPQLDYKDSVASQTPAINATKTSHQNVHSPANKEVSPAPPRVVSTQTQRSALGKNVLLPSLQNHAKPISTQQEKAPSQRKLPDIPSQTSNKPAPADMTQVQSEQATTSNFADKGPSDSLHTDAPAHPELFHAVADENGGYIMKPYKGVVPV